MTQTQYENYFVNEEGEVFSTRYNKVRKMKPATTADGYLQMIVYNNCKRKAMLVHRLVAQTFIPNPKNKPEVNHKNAIKSDNRVQNLEWATRKENTEHAILNGLINPPMGETHYKSKLTEKQVLEIRRLFSTKKYNQAQLGKMFGIPPQTISSIINNKRWKHI